MTTTEIGNTCESITAYCEASPRYRIVTVGTPRAMCKDCSTPSLGILINLEDVRFHEQAHEEVPF